MPIYEYKCEKCGKLFEVMVRPSEKPKCPRCSSKKLKKQISGFSTPKSSGGKSRCCGHCGCGHCGCGHCGH